MTIEELKAEMQEIINALQDKIEHLQNRSLAAISVETDDNVIFGGRGAAGFYASIKMTAKIKDEGGEISISVLPKLR